jgi:hypothetical protein
LSSGYIAGGAIAGVLIGFMAFNEDWLKQINLTRFLPAAWNDSVWPAAAIFSFLVFVLFLTGVGVLFRGAQLRGRGK